MPRSPKKASSSRWSCARRGARYQIIAGERRYHAAVQAGLHELPVVIRDVDDGEMLELALIENIQRKDLTPFEESDALGGLAQKFGYTHEDLAKRLGKSRTSITEALSLNTIPPDVRKVCRLAASRIDRCCCRSSARAIAQKMLALVEKITSQGAHARTTPQGSREAESRRPPEVVRVCVRPPTKAFNLRLQFNKRNASKDEVISALEEILRELRTK